MTSAGWPFYSRSKLWACISMHSSNIKKRIIVIIVIIVIIFIGFTRCSWCFWVDCPVRL